MRSQSATLTQVFINECVTLNELIPTLLTRLCLKLLLKCYSQRGNSFRTCPIGT